MHYIHIVELLKNTESIFKTVSALPKDDYYEVEIYGYLLLSINSMCKQVCILLLSSLILFLPLKYAFKT